MTDPTSQVTTAPLTAASAIVDKINSLQEALKTNSPLYESLLHTIHVALSKDAEAAHLLTDEQVGTIIQGLAKKKNIVIAAVETKSRSNKTASGKSLKDVNLGDL